MSEELKLREDKLKADESKFNAKSAALEAEKAKIETLKATWISEMAALKARSAALHGEVERMKNNPPEMLCYEDDEQITRLEADKDKLREDIATKDKAL